MKMKKYVKPTIVVVELRPEERLAGCGNQRPDAKDRIQAIS
jgi:hypothetical protein